MAPPTSTHLARLARQDPALGRVMKRLPRFPGFPLAAERRRSRYESLARAIVYQQVSGAAAATIFRRACALTGGPGFPRPEDLVELSDDDLRSAGLSRGKVRAVRDLAERVVDGRLKLAGVHRLDDEEVIARLVEVHGIGTWSAQMFLMFKLGRLDVMPTTDLGIQEGLRVLDGLAERPGPSAVGSRAEAWRGLCSIASWYLWRLAEDAKERART